MAYKDFSKRRSRPTKIQYGSYAELTNEQKKEIEMFDDDKDLARILREMRSDVTRAVRSHGGYRRRPIRKRRGISGKRFIQKYTWDHYDAHIPKVKMSNTDMFLGSSDMSDYISSQMMSARDKASLETLHLEFTIIADRGQWQKEIMSSDLRIIQFRANNGMIIDDEDLSYIGYEVNSSSIIVRAWGSKIFVEHWHDYLTEQYEEVKNVIEWVYNGDGSSIEIPVRGDRAPVDEMYPFLKGETLNEYYDRFMHSSASILLLIGPPGTGKTTFIRGLLQHSEVSALVTYDTAILSKDHIFAEFIEGDRNVMVIEDADNFLGARTDGNDFMHKFLNVGDGLVTAMNKKMIFSTNLPSIKDVDPALIRPGRCFDIVHFDTLTQEQAVALADKVGVQLDGEREKWSIADVFHKQVDAPRAPKRKLGFV